MIRIARLVSVLRRSGEDDEAGFSVVEMVASLTVLAIGIVSLLGTLVVAARAAGTQRGRINAVQAANQALEDARARPYTQIRLFAGDPNFALRPQTAHTTDTVTTASPTDPHISVRAEPIVLAGVRYDVLRNVAWVDFTDTQTGRFYPRAYKLVVVRVSWRDHVGSHSIQVDGYVYPGGQGEQPAPGCEQAISAPQQPVTATASVTIPEIPSITVTWRDRARNECNYQVQYAQSTTPVNCANLMPFQWIAAAMELPPDREEFHFNAAFGTGYCFRVRAVNPRSPGADDPAAGWVYTTWVSTPAPLLRCTMSAPVVRSPSTNTGNPNRIRIQAAQGWNLDDIAFAITASGNCTRIWAEVVNRSGQTVATANFTQSGTQWFVVQPQNWQRFNLGYGTVTFRAQGEGNPGPTFQTVCYYRTGGGGTC